jgi:hypothetical protein
METLLHSPPNPWQEEGEMIGFDRWTDIPARARRGETRQQIARDLGIEQKMLRRILSLEGKTAWMPSPRRRAPRLAVQYAPPF